MVKSARREYLETIRKRYCKACRRDKKPILDEFCTNWAYSGSIGLFSGMFLQAGPAATRAHAVQKNFRFSRSLLEKPAESGPISGYGCRSISSGAAVSVGVELRSPT